MKTYLVGTHKKHLTEALVMSTITYMYLFVENKKDIMWIPPFTWSYDNTVWGMKVCVMEFSYSFQGIIFALCMYDKHNEMCTCGIFRVKK